MSVLKEEMYYAKQEDNLEAWLMFQQADAMIRLEISSQLLSANLQLALDINAMTAFILKNVLANLRRYNWPETSLNIYKDKFHEHIMERVLVLWKAIRRKNEEEEIIEQAI